jgi:hypothetical protein
MSPEPNGRRLFSWHGRVALRDTTVPDSAWHSVSGRGASEARLPKPLTQGNLQCNSYSLDGQACRADLFARYPMPLELEEKMAGVRSAVGH